ncbi:flavin monoamine oxidase family protein [Mongoliitalea daihaiensis]|uniref:flavin monoamine oxidase family protein n=1 Tax=Mongoliitalea daihaiensis TaxID=2782006 RepID=UPI001F41372D|nr:flavin monoamine oxidase family protein [Mongoliitalea daihaiensis]UJP63614.1 flavin monoamine oxidase family protein [Mongoliitalea daihaiensis]
MLDVLIIGAGFSGIAAGKKLFEVGKTFRILEARDRIGGRVYTKRWEDGFYLDLGGQWIGPTQDRMYELCREYGVDYFETYDEGKNLLDLNKKIRSYAGLIPKMDIISLVNLDWLMKKMEKMAASIDPSSPWTHPEAKEYDSISLEAFIHQNCKTQACKKVIRLACETVFAAEMNEVSLLHALFYIRSGTDLNTLISIQNGAQLHRIQGGMGTIAERMAKAFEDSILFSHAVHKIEQTDSFVTVFTEKSSFQAKKLILAIPPPLAAKIDFSPMLPANKRQVLDRIAMGQVGKCFMVYKKPFWRDKGFSGQVLADEHSPFQTLFDASPKDGSIGIILGFTIAERCRAYFEHSKENRQKAMEKQLVSYFGPEASTPIRYEDFTMTDEAWSRGCYAGLYPTGAWTGFQDAYRQTTGNIHWAGTEAATRWFGYIEGAVLAGEKAANDIVLSLVDTGDWAD